VFTIGVLVAVALLLSACGRGPGTTAAAAVDVARLVDIGGGRQMYLECRGHGSPTVVLVAGTAGAHDEWTHVVDETESTPRPSPSAVLPEVSRFGRVCAYDRPGTTLMDGAASRSTPVPQPTSAQTDAADLHALLAAAGEHGPYVLVGASWGGMIIDLFARTDPTDVAGLVFVDGASEFFQQTLTPQQWSAWMNAIKTATPIGQEAPDYESSVVEISAAGPMAAVPAVVLTADTPWNLPLGDAGPTWPAWTAAQENLARVLHADHVTNTHSGHGIAVEQPLLVTNAIRAVMAGTPVTPAG
jgi:pimeloyl-ACP methyl ester carboxylesterase